MESTKYGLELEIPEHIANKKRPDNFEFSSKKKGFLRYQTEEIRQFVKEQNRIDDDILIRSLNLIGKLFQQFYSYHQIWDIFIQILSELDCLCSLSEISFSKEIQMTRPEIHKATYQHEVYMRIEEGIHPTLFKMNKGKFIPNDINIGNVSEENNKNMIILTGPNMGGKSTVLRTTCIFAILGQIGCYVPAKHCEFSLVDKVYTRIGAQDKLLEGKSTFYLELEETLQIINYSTINSLIIMDELGRGTSTFDGLSIASAVAKYLVQKVHCRCVFATHYFFMLEDFKKYDNVEF